MAVIAFLYALALLAGLAISAVRARAYLRRRPGASPGAAVLLRPVAGASEDELLASARRARRSFPLEVLLAVESPRDPGHAAAERAARAMAESGLPARVVLTGGGGPNHKAAQLAAALRVAPPSPVVIVADADVDLEGTDLDALAGSLEGADAAWAPPVEVAPRTRADEASAALLSASLHAFPLLCGTDPGGLVGKLFAVRRDALDRAGGFEALEDRLGEDVELARRLRGRVRPAPLVARSVASGRTMDEVVDRYARWLFVVRGQRRWLFATYPFFFLGTWICLAASPLGTLPLLGALVALATRLATAPIARRLSGLPAGGPGAWIAQAFAADLLLARAFLRNVRARSLRWRGRELAIDGDGRLREVAGPRG